MTTLALLGSLLLAAVLAIEVWGRQPHWMPLEDMRLLNNSVVILVRRGRHASSLLVNWADRDESLVVTKHVRGPGRIVLTIALPAGATLASCEVELSDFVGDRAQTAAFSDSVRGVRDSLEREAERLQLRLLAGARLQLTGILSFNVPPATGIPRGE